jgi:choline kinase
LRRQPIKAIVLAAGEGKRLKKYTKNLPKGMLEFYGKSLIERLVILFRRVAVDEIIIVKGFEHEKINFPGVTYYMNERFDSTNMLVSLFCAEERMEGDVIVCYSDILFEIRLLRQLMQSRDDIVVAVDTNWKHYWNMRYGTADFDTESLRIGDNNRIVSIGAENPLPEEIDARYIGLIKFSDIGIKQLKETWKKYKDEYWNRPWQVSGQPLRNAYMTDMLNALIEEGYAVTALQSSNGWIEFDTDKDYENALEWQKNGTLDSLIKID